MEVRASGLEALTVKPGFPNLRWEDGMKREGKCWEIGRIISKQISRVRQRIVE